MADPNFSIHIADWQRDRDQLALVREQVFVREQKVPLEMEWDGDDEQALHLLAEDATGQSIGTARLLPTGHLGRMAVLSDWRGKGVGAALLRELLKLARERDYPPLFLNAQTSAVGFYLKFGFVTEGAEFMDAGIPHLRMVPA